MSDYNDRVEHWLKEPTAPLDCTAPTGPRGKLSIATRRDPKLTIDALWSAIDQAEAVSGVARSVPEGWITVYDFIARERALGRIWTRGSAGRHLDGLVESGALQTGKALRDGKVLRCWGLPSKLPSPHSKCKDGAA